jgi:ferritin-like metal-binding protein YciE
MAKVQEPRDLLEEKLTEMLYVERKLADEILPKLQEEISNAEFQRGITKHLEETRQHAMNVERVLDMLGMEAKEGKCPTLDGMEDEHKKGVKDIDSDMPELIDLFDAGAAAATEHYEIASYNGLIEIVDAMGEGRAASLLRENLEQEQKALREVEQVSQKLTRELVAV